MRKIHPDDLKKLHKKIDIMNGYGVLSPYSILIQQDKRKLFDLRFHTGYYDES